MIKQIGRNYFVSTPKDGIVAGPFKLRGQAVMAEKEALTKPKQIKAENNGE